MSTLYSENVIDHYQNPRNWGKLKNPTKAYTLHNPLCGDSMTIDIHVEDEKIKDIAFSGSGCAISHAGASLFTEHIKGKKISDLRNIEKSVILQLMGIHISPIRLKCATLAFAIVRHIITR
ncbi:MAG TPA: SUF system NifU family Fe-S cluster assembly protein [Patescibacteria group bacterium]|nr:SUF system NifU family Fe-S cluster assembly protein [Patescibacteria group bacterium]